MATTEIPNGKVGVLVRKFGKPLEPGEVLATGNDSKGILRETKGPGSAIGWFSRPDAPARNRPRGPNGE